MPTIRKTQIPPPESDEDFEDLCLNIAKELWRDPEAYKVGTQGQNQHGVDVCAANALQSNLVYGVQAKKKKGLTKQKLTKQNINETLEKANDFTPSLNKIVIATTATKDAILQSFIAGKKRERREKSLFPFEVWFWEDIEDKLRQECHSTYLGYLSSILPESAIDHLSKDIIIEALTVAEEFARKNYVEKSEGVLFAFKGVINRSTLPEIKLLAKRIEIQLHLRKEQNDKAIELINELHKEYPSDLDVLWLLYDRAIEDEDLGKAEDIVNQIKEIGSSSPVYQIIDLVHRFHTGKEIDISEDEPPGRNNREKAITFQVYHLYANIRGNKELRQRYLNKYEELLPVSSKPIFYQIIYKSNDVQSDSENLTLEKIDNALQEISALESKLANKNPISLSDGIILALEKITLHVLKVSHFSPHHQLPSELRAFAIAGICQTYYNTQNEQRLIKLLTLFPLDKEELDRIIEYLTNSSRRTINRKFAYLLLAQAFMEDKNMDYANDMCTKLSLNEQHKFIDSIKNQDIDQALNQIEELDNRILFFVLRSLPDKSILLSLINKILPDIDDEDVKAGLIGIQIFLILEEGGEDAVDKLKKEINIKKQGFVSSLKIAKIANEKGLHDIEVEALNNVLRYSLPDDHKIDIIAQLMSALFKMGDYPGVLEHKDCALSYLNKLSEHNQLAVIQIIVLSLYEISHLKEAHSIISKQIYLYPNEFGLRYLKAKIEIDEEEYSVALTTILEGLRTQNPLTREMFLSCHNFLVEITHALDIENENLIIVEENSYVKLSDIDTWFYVGDKKPINASLINSTTDRYTAIMGRSLGQEIEWPPDKYSRPPKKRTIESILAEPVYVGRKATEYLKQIAEEGDANIDLLNVGKEGDLDILKSFWQEKIRDKHSFFETYKSGRFPFIYLAHSIGSFGMAVAKLQSMQEGFIHINDGTRKTIDAQKERASNIIDGEPAFIDATSLLFLIETGLIEQLSANKLKIYYTPSVVNYIREHASHFAPSRYQFGRLAFSKTYEPVLFPYDYQNEKRIKEVILSALEHFEKNANKETEKFISSKESEIEMKLAPYIMDPHIAARLKGYPIITEDYFCSRAMKHFTNEEQAQPVSSLALIEMLFLNKSLNWNQYLNYLDHLLANRCYLVPISANIIYKAVFGDNYSGLLIFQPSNLKKLHLELSLSEEYGVRPIIAIRIISEFIEMIVNDDTIDLSTFKTLLTQFLREVSKRRNSSFGNTLVAACQQKLENQDALIYTQLRDRKKEFLESQIEIHFAELIIVH